MPILLNQPQSPSYPPASHLQPYLEMVNWKEIESTRMGLAEVALGVAEGQRAEGRTLVTGRAVATAAVGGRGVGECWSVTTIR